MDFVYKAASVVVGAILILVALGFYQSGVWCQGPCLEQWRADVAGRGRSERDFQRVNNDDGISAIGHRYDTDVRRESSGSRIAPGHPDFQKWDSIARKAGLEFQSGTGYWEGKDVTVPYGQVPEQGWHQKGPGRGRWVCKTNCPPGVQRYGED